jgi:hypothetical protein
MRSGVMSHYEAMGVSISESKPKSYQTRNNLDRGSESGRDKVRNRHRQQRGVKQEGPRLTTRPLSLATQRTSLNWRKPTCPPPAKSRPRWTASWFVSMCNTTFASVGNRLRKHSHGNCCKVSCFAARVPYPRLVDRTPTVASGRAARATSSVA